MKRIMAIIIASAFMGILASSVLAATGPLAVAVEVKDGSRVVGTINLESVKFVATYGCIQIVTREIKTIEVNAQLESAKIVMVNGDTLQGVLDLDKLTIHSLLGDIELRLVDVTKITVIQPELPAK